MAGRIKNCKPPFYVYYLPKEHYVGVTTNLHKRMLKHKSKSSFNVSNYKILGVFDNYIDALSFEETTQKNIGCPISNVRNQNGKNNPIAKVVLHTLTGVYFDTIKQASEALNYPYSDVRHKISNKNNKYNLIRL